MFRKSDLPKTEEPASLTVAGSHLLTFKNMEGLFLHYHFKAGAVYV
jgi:hypothetical protein